MKKTGYAVEFTHEVFNVTNAMLANVLQMASGAANPRVLLVADMNFVQRNDGVGFRIGEYFQKYGIELAGTPVVFGGGEKLKNDGFGSVVAVITAMIKSLLGDGGIVLMLGGGSTFDVAGMASALVRKDVKIVRIPTTPAAMLDAAYSGYSAVDVAGVKDSVRIPSVPAAVIIDVSLASTVLDGVWNGGFGEAVRVATVMDATLVKRLAECASAYRGRDLGLLDQITRDVHDIRVNKTVPGFAEWIARRLEAMSGWKLPHGYSVPIGIAVESEYSVEKGWMKDTDRDIVMKALRDSGTIDGAYQSRYLLAQFDELMRGLKEWNFLEGVDTIVYPSALGKSRKEIPDLETYRAVLAKF